MTAPNLRVEEKQIVSGMCRNAKIRKDDTFTITSAPFQAEAVF